MVLIKSMPRCDKTLVSLEPKLVCLPCVMLECVESAFITCLLEWYGLLDSCVGVIKLLMILCGLEILAC